MEHKPSSCGPQCIGCALTLVPTDVAELIWAYQGLSPVNRCHALARLRHMLAKLQNGIRHGVDYGPGTPGHTSAKDAP